VSERVTVARTVDEVEALRPAWERLPVGDIDADIDYFLTVIRHRSEVVRPHVVLIERDGAPRLMIAARLEEAAMDIRLGYRVLARPRLRTLRVAFGGVVGAAGDDDRRRALDELQRPLREGEADAVVLAQIEADGPLCALARESGSRMRRPHLDAPTAHWSVAIPGSMEEFLAQRSSRTRKNIRYYDRRLVRDNPDLRVRTFRSESELDELCADMEQIAATTYQRTLGAGFTGDDQDRALMALGMARGWFRAWVLYLGDRPVAFWHGYAYGGTFTTGCPGFDPAFARDRVGAYLAVRMIEQLCTEDALHTLDWGAGDAEYKRTLGDAGRQEVDMMIFAPTVAGLRAGFLRLSVAALAHVGKRTLGDRGVRRARRMWRDRLAPEAP
jgi:CelD/BcsL family acetyltransferase involved in cellulose biosynthesis